MAPEQVRRLQQWLSQPEAQLFADHLQTLEIMARTTAAEQYIAAQENPLELAEAQAAAKDVILYRRMLALIRAATDGEKDNNPYDYVR
jgi:hypothetical protein